MSLVSGLVEACACGGGGATIMFGLRHLFWCQLNDRVGCQYLTTIKNKKLDFYVMLGGSTDGSPGSRDNNARPLGKVVIRLRIATRSEYGTSCVSESTCASRSTDNPSQPPHQPTVLPCPFLLPSWATFVREHRRCLVHVAPKVAVAGA